MTDAELEEFLSGCPTLFHMAERGAWPAIKSQGLLSTSALLDLYNLRGAERSCLEEEHRPRSVAIDAPGLPGAVIRDQSPLSDEGLRRSLRAGLTPSDWYKLLNGKVFFWTSEDRLHKLTSAKSYRDREHDVLEVDSRSLIHAYRDHIWLCPINSGCTKPYPHPRGADAFARIPDYPYHYWRSRRKPTERIVEVAIDYAVRDVSLHVRRVMIKKREHCVTELKL